MIKKAEFVKSEGCEEECRFRVFFAGVLRLSMKMFSFFYRPYFPHCSLMPATAAAETVF